MNLATKKTTSAIIMKLISSPKNAPQAIENFQKESVAVFQAPPGINGVSIGIIILSTRDLINDVEATPITNAIARAKTLYSFMNSKNSKNIFFIIK